MFKKGVSGNYAGRPKGSSNRVTLLRHMIEDAFERNAGTAVTYLDGMFEDKDDFKWLCALKASMEPKLKSVAPTNDNQYRDIRIVSPSFSESEHSKVPIPEGRTVTIERF